MKTLSLTSAPVGEQAVIFYLPEPVQDDYPLILQSLSTHIQGNGIIDCVVAYHSLLVIFDPIKHSAKTLSTALENYLPETVRLSQRPGEQRTIRVPVCYESPYALDLDSIAERAKLSPEAVIASHSGKSYTACCLGFIPGFAFLGYVDDAIASPRHSEPRTKIPTGSVGIAGNQTGVYPAESPGGWQIIGRTPMTLYAPEKGLFSRFATGDKVQFYAITADEFSAWSDND